MNLELRRMVFTADSTQGELYINGVFECYTLEDRFRPGDIFKVKIEHQTAIPTGVYSVIIDFSQRFGRLMPHVLDVPAFVGIRFHNGHDKENTDGCPLLGDLVGENWVGDKLPKPNRAFDRFFDKLKTALDSGEKCVISIRNEVQPYLD